MEPEIHFTDYPSLYPHCIPKMTEKEREELRNKLVNDAIRMQIGGNEEIHKL